MIKCSECGRAVSDQAAACVGCGAPLPRPNNMGAFNLVPEDRPARLPTAGQIRLRALLSALALVAGVIWSGAAGHGAGRNRLAALMAAMLIIGGLCGLLIALVHNLALRNATKK